MSLEYFLYSFDSRPITVKEIQRELLQFGWGSVVGRDRAGHNEWEVHQTGLLRDLDHIFGWRSDHPDAAEILAGLIAKDRDTLTRYGKGGDVTTCLVYAAVPYDASKHLKDKEILDELIEDYGREYIAARRKAKARYGTRTAATRRQIAALLQADVTKAVVRLRGGLFENTIRCQYEILEPGNEPSVNW